MKKKVTVFICLLAVAAIVCTGTYFYYYYHYVPKQVYNESRERAIKKVTEQYVDKLVEDGEITGTPKPIENSYVDNGLVIVYDYSLDSDDTLRITYDTVKDNITYKVLQSED